MPEARCEVSDFYCPGCPVVKEHVAGGLLWRHFAEIDRRGLAVFSPQHHKTAAANIPGLRMGDRQRVAYRYRRIDSVTARRRISTPTRVASASTEATILPGAYRVEHIFLYAIRDRRRRWRIGGDGKAAPASNAAMTT